MMRLTKRKDGTNGFDVDDDYENPKPPIISRFARECIVIVGCVLVIFMAMLVFLHFATPSIVEIRDCVAVR